MSGGGVMVSFFFEKFMYYKWYHNKDFLVQYFLCMLMEKEFLFLEYIFLNYEVTHPHSKMIKLRLKHRRELVLPGSATVIQILTNLTNWN